MNTSSTTHNRSRRSTAGVNKRYDEREYVLVSFPNVNKHSIVPAASVNVDPLDKQNGSIKTFGSKKNLRIISSGPKDVMKERASRFAAAAGSEEIELDPDENESNQNEEESDDEYALTTTHSSGKQIRKQITTNEHPKLQSDTMPSNNDDYIMAISNDERSENASASRKTPLHNRELNFNRVYSSTQSLKRNHDNDFNESSLSGSDAATADEYEKDLPGVNKNNELRSMLKKPYRKRKKQVIESSTDENRLCSGCLENERRILQLEKRMDQTEKRTDRMEKVVPVLKKYRQSRGTPIAVSNEANMKTDASLIFEEIEKITGVNPNEITSTLARPTLVMRELIRKADHIGDKAYFRQHEKLFKNFIQVKCLIDDDGMKTVWKEITSSVGRQHLDEESNKKKKKSINSSCVVVNSIPPTSAQEIVTEKEKETTLSALTTTTAAATTEIAVTTLDSI